MRIKHMLHEEQALSVRPVVQSHQRRSCTKNRTTHDCSKIGDFCGCIVCCQLCNLVVLSVHLKKFPLGWYSMWNDQRHQPRHTSLFPSIHRSMNGTRGPTCPSSYWFWKHIHPMIVGPEDDGYSEPHLNLTRCISLDWTRQKLAKLDEPFTALMHFPQSTLARSVDMIPRDRTAWRKRRSTSPEETMVEWLKEQVVKNWNITNWWARLFMIVSIFSHG